MAKKKGFRTGQGLQRTAHLTFEEGHVLHGLEVDVKLRVPVAVMLGASAGNFAQAIEPIIGRITGWNLEDEKGEPVPVSRDAFAEHFDSEEATSLIRAWVEAATQAPAPLDD
jgi:hypothetical protein